MDKLEPSSGTWNFSATDSVVSNDLAHGLDTEGILIGTPGWAVNAGQTPGNGLPKGLGRAVTDPANVWADFVRQTVRHYAGQVAYWEIWNEPDLKYFWTSSPSDYYQLLKTSYTVIKSVDPTAKVVLAGMVVPDLQFFSAVLDAAKADGYESSHSWLLRYCRLARIWAGKTGIPEPHADALDSRQPRFRQRSHLGNRSRFPGFQSERREPAGRIRTAIDCLCLRSRGGPRFRVPRQ